MYEANTTSGFADWLSAAGWKQAGAMLVNDGSNSSGSGFIAAPLDIGTPNYYIEAELGIVKWDQCSNQFGLVARGGAYSATLGRLGIGFPCPVGFSIRYKGSEILGESEDVSGLTSWNTFRLEVNGDGLKFSVNGRVVVSVLDNRVLDAGETGLVSIGAQVNARLVRVVGE